MATTKKEAKSRAADAVGLNELLPCPFCGSKDVELFETDFGYDVVCHNCQCRTGTGVSKEEVISAWNTRAR